MNRFKLINCAAMTAMMVGAFGLAGCQPRRPAPEDIYLHHNELIIPRSDDLFPDGDSFSGQTPVGDQAHNRNRRRDRLRRAERREVGRNRKTRIGARKKQRSGGRTRGR